MTVPDVTGDRIVWREWYGRGFPEDQRVLFADAWTGDVTGVARAIAQEGWMSMREATEYAHPANLVVGWYGYRTGESVPEICDEDGESRLGDGGYVELTLRITWIVVP